jgi:arylamine N-acetyltransferase
MKICFKCGNEKELSEYYKHAQMKDGHLNKCKVCTKKDAKTREVELLKDPKWHEAEKKRHRDKYYRLGYKDKHKPTYEMKKEAMSRYKAKFPEKIAAASKTSGMKTIIKGNHLHHWSYNEEHYKDVIELTEKYHNLIHRYIEYDQNEKMYRTIGGILLDNKEHSISYYDLVIELYGNELIN